MTGESNNNAGTNAQGLLEQLECSDAEAKTCSMQAAFAGAELPSDEEVASGVGFWQPYVDPSPLPGQAILESWSEATVVLPSLAEESDEKGELPKLG